MQGRRGPSQALTTGSSRGGMSSPDREAALWDMEEHHLQERHQLVKQQLKDQYFLQRHELVRKHEKVRLRWGGVRHRETRESEAGRGRQHSGAVCAPKSSQAGHGEAGRFWGVSCLGSRGHE